MTKKLSLLIAICAMVWCAACGSAEPAAEAPKEELVEIKQASSSGCSTWDHGDQTFVDATSTQITLSDTVLPNMANIQLASPPSIGITGAIPLQGAMFTVQPGSSPNVLVTYHFDPNASSAGAVAWSGNCGTIRISGSYSIVTTINGQVTSDTLGSGHLVFEALFPAPAPQFDPPPGTYCEAWSLYKDTGGSMVLVADGSYVHNGQSTMGGVSATAHTLGVSPWAGGSVLVAGHYPGNVPSSSPIIGYGLGDVDALGDAYTLGPDLTATNTWHVDPVSGDLVAFVGELSTVSNVNNEYLANERYYLMGLMYHLEQSIPGGPNPDDCSPELFDEVFSPKDPPEEDKPWYRRLTCYAKCSAILGFLNLWCRAWYKNDPDARRECQDQASQYYAGCLQDCDDSNPD